MLDLKRDRRFRYILVFKNHGAAAGATLEHSHSQLIALPIVPDFVREEIEGARRHYAAKERCVFCDIVRQEMAAGRRVIHENADIVALAPYAPRFPFETWLLPRSHGARFEEAPRHEYESLARMLKSVLARMNRALESPPYNLIIHSAPFSEEAARVLPLARRAHAEADADGRLRVGDRLLHQPDVAGGGARGAARRVEAVSQPRTA